jgi:hypothetical protein
MISFKYRKVWSKDECEVTESRGGVVRTDTLAGCSSHVKHTSHLSKCFLS